MPGDDAPDPEKDEVREAYATSSNDGSSDGEGAAPRPQPLEAVPSSRSSRRAASARPAEDAAPLSRSRTGASAGSGAAGRPAEFEVAFGDEDAANPRNFSLRYKAWVIFAVSYSTWVIVLYSTSYTASIPGLMREFRVASAPVATLGVTTYLLGLAAGSLVVAPLSELYGRRPVYIVCLAVATLLVLPCCLASSLAEIVAVRFVG